MCFYCLYYDFLLYWLDCNLPATAGTTSKDLEWITILVDLILGFIDGLLLGSARLLLPECLRETKEKHDLKGHRARTQTAALRPEG